MTNSIFSVGTALTKAAVFTLLTCGIIAAADNTNSIFPLLPPSVSTIPSNGDVNPYGVAFVPGGVPGDGLLRPGDVLVSNFNNSANLQGLGTTIVRVDKTGQVSTFFTSPAAQQGLSAALGILTNGMVFIGNLPTADGTSGTAQAGTLSVVSRTGQLLGSIIDVKLINGPWGMAVYDIGKNGFGQAKIFVSNVLSGVITRLDIVYTPDSAHIDVLVLATGFNHHPDPAALELGPSGLAYDAGHDILFVASSVDNAIYTIADAASTTAPVNPSLFFQDLVHLHGPLDLALLRNDHLLVANSDGSNADPNQPSELVEFATDGTFLGEMPVDPNNGGAFGLAVRYLSEDVFRLAAVDDNANTLTFWTSSTGR